MQMQIQIQFKNIYTVSIIIYSFFVKTVHEREIEMEREKTQNIKREKKNK